MMRPMPLKFLCALLAFAASSAFASTRLLTAGDWQTLCKQFDTPEKQAICYAKFHRGTAGGRSLGTFTAVRPHSDQVLQSRSGVYFSPALNNIIESVREDSNLRTRLALEHDAHCQAYSSISAMQSALSRAGERTRLIQAWLTEYTDAGYGPIEASVQRQERQGVLEFHVVTDSSRRVVGRFLQDGRYNAAVFATCDYPVESSAAAETVSRFFSSVMGSARNYANAV